MQRSARIVFYFATAFAFVMATLPKPPILPGSPSDKLQHMLAFAVLAVVGAIAFPQSPRLRLWSGLIAFGGLIELVQAIPALHRDSDLADLGADAIAVLVAGLAWEAIRRWRGR